MKIYKTKQSIAVEHKDFVYLSAHTGLVECLLRECDFPAGCFLMTGACIVPGHRFTLQSQDEITITIDHIGTLVNTVA